MPSCVIRELRISETGLLEQATLENLNAVRQRFTINDIRARPDFAHYTLLVPGRGDFGFVAEVDGQTIGVGWALFLPEDDPGYGFVDGHIPEIGLWVSATSRGQGVGRALLQRLIAAGTDRELPGLSLSVEQGNSARNLYLSCGFADVAGLEAHGVMLRELRQKPRGKIDHKKT
ncbi:GNAT family N-acetyltransferase [Corynebacterium mendelii]|uniref:GNAT family N-acetyltransferase n=1 Tax=Corynebacterium mendelii TaxID=2765362 RepID=A0A939ITH1_9CORY|nr:GNAT family N-acetyltransferase [Corynebacterium mendelii]MBN9643849.1 GNAT family N-acetyltransferase [Corynebacterium mendelii]